MANNKQTKDIEDYLSFLFISRLLQPVKKTKAFNMGLVDGEGKILREPETEEEEAELTLLDKTIFHLQRTLKGKLNRLQDFMFVHITEEPISDRLVLRGSMKERAQLNMVRNKIDKHLREEMDIDFNEFLTLRLLEEVRSYQSERKIDK